MPENIYLLTENPEKTIHLKTVDPFMEDKRIMMPVDYKMLVSDQSERRALLS